MKSFFATCIVGFSLSSFANAHDIRIHNYIAKFITYYDQTERLPFQERVSKWDEYISANPALFDRILYLRAPKEEALEKAFVKFPHEIHKIRSLNKNLKEVVAKEVASYKKLFPGVQLTFDFYFAVCDFGFGGMVSEIKGRPAMVTCVEKSDGFESNLSHELAHAFHYQTNPAIAKDMSIAAIVLKEGFAVFCNRQKYETSLEREVWGDKGPDGGIEAVVKKEKLLMAELWKDLDKTDKATRVKWLGWSREHALVPKAGGYYVGNLILEDLLRSKSIDEIIKLNGPTLRKAVKGAIRKRLKSPYQKLSH